MRVWFKAKIVGSMGPCFSTEGVEDPAIDEIWFLVERIGACSLGRTVENFLVDPDGNIYDAKSHAGFEDCYFKGKTHTLHKCEILEAIENINA